MRLRRLRLWLQSTLVRATSASDILDQEQASSEHLQKTPVKPQITKHAKNIRALLLLTRELEMLCCSRIASDDSEMESKIENSLRQSQDQASFHLIHTLLTAKPPTQEALCDHCL